MLVEYKCPLVPLFILRKKTIFYIFWNNIGRKAVIAREKYVEYQIQFFLELSWIFLYPEYFWVTFIHHIRASRR